MQINSFLPPRFWPQSLAMFVLVCGLTVNANAQSVVIINDDFLDGSPLNSNAALESQWFTTSSSSALDDSAMGISPGSLEFATGGSGRAIHTTFANQNLGMIGDMIFSSLNITTPTTVGSDRNNGLRFGIFNDAGRNLAVDINSSSGSPNPILGDTGIGGTTIGLAGFSADYDVNDLSGGAPADEVRLRQADPADARGRLLTTTGGFVSIADQDAPGDVNGFVAGSDYEVNIKVTRTSATDVLVETQLLDSLGAVLNSTSATAIADSFDFSLISVSTASSTFGSSSTRGEPDNGLVINNAFVEFTTSAVPEPSSLALLGLLSCAGFIRRRR